MKRAYIKRPIIDGQKQCQHCNEWLPIAKFRFSYYGEHKNTYRDPRCDDCRKLAYLARNTGASFSAVRDTHAQATACDICDTPCGRLRGTGGRLQIDHNHTTGMFRGMLCVNCNQMIGCAQESVARLEMAIHYLTKGGLAAHPLTGHKIKKSAAQLVAEHKRTVKTLRRIPIE